MPEALQQAYQKELAVRNRRDAVKGNIDQLERSPERRAFSEAQGRLRQAQSEVSGLESQRQSLPIEIESIKNRNRTIPKEIESENDKVAVQERIAVAAERKANEARQSIDEGRRKMEPLIRNIKIAEAQMRDAKSDEDTLRAGRDRLDGRYGLLSRLNSSIDELNRELNRPQSGSQIPNPAYSQLENERARINRDLQQAESDLAAAKGSGNGGGSGTGERETLKNVLEWESYLESALTVQIK